jgi:hypothetical protein
LSQQRSNLSVFETLACGLKRVFTPYHDERDVYENTLEITVSDLRVGDDTNGYF